MTARRPTWSLLALVSTAMLAIAAAAVVIPLRLAEPATLSGPQATKSVPVTTRSISDERQLQLELTTGAPRTVGAPRAGTLTSFDCATGSTLTSGEALASIDGSPVVALATDVPLWRDLTVGDHGDDVLSLQRELDRISPSLEVDGVVGRKTIAAVKSLQSRQGSTTSTDLVIPRSAFTWIPHTSVIVRSCDASVGSRLEAHSTLATLPVELRAARLRSLPTTSMEGARVVVTGSSQIPIAENGDVTDASALAMIASTTEFLSSLASPDDQMSLPVVWKLTKPANALVVPPGALSMIRGSEACLTPAGRGVAPVSVRILGSDLGQSFVTTISAKPPTEVVAAPDADAPCR